MRKDDDQEQMKYLAEWKKTHKGWIVEKKYFSHEITARIYATYLRLRYPDKRIRIEKEQ